MSKPGGSQACGTSLVQDQHRWAVHKIVKEDVSFRGGRTLGKREDRGAEGDMADDVKPEELDITDELIAERRAEQPGETPETMTSWQRPITAFIDILNNWAGRVICLLLVPLIGVMVPVH